MNSFTRQFCSNPHLNEVFVRYSEKMEALGVKCRMNINVMEEELPYKELCQILSNGLENACDTLKGLDIEKREISIQMKCNRNYLLIRVRNRCRDDFHVERLGGVDTSDKEENDCSFGLAMVKEMVGRLDGDMFYYTENGNFVLDVMISCQSFLKKYGT